MSVIASRLRRYWPEALWALFAAGNIVAMLVSKTGETIPFHFVWVSLTILYGFRPLGLKATTGILLLVSAATGGALLYSTTRTHVGLDEVAEVPLMAAMFVAMVWHARRRQAAMEQVHRLAESELRLEREREFLGNASHELRTPITVARGHAELIRANYFGQQASEDAQVVLEELGRLSKIAERLLILAAAEHASFLRRTPVELEDLLAAAAKRWQGSARRRWTVCVDLKGTVLADEERLAYALDAIFENAVKFTREGDRIELAARAEGETALIEVFDSGTGIAPDQLSWIFDRFFRGDRGREDSVDGAGLGLAIAQAIVNSHGGTISAESEQGMGTRFHIRLPGFEHAGVSNERRLGSAAASVA